MYLFPTTTVSVLKRKRYISGFAGGLWIQLADESVLGKSAGRLLEKEPMGDL